MTAVWHLWWLAQMKHALGDVFYCFLQHGCWLPAAGGVL